MHSKTGRSWKGNLLLVIALLMGLGASQGREFARAHWKNLEMMARINDFEWLDSVYREIAARVAGESPFTANDILPSSQG